MSWIPKKTVVVPIDFSDSAPDAITTALELVAHPRDVHVLHVVPPLKYVSPVGLPLGIWGQVADGEPWDAQAREHLSAWLRERRFDGVTEAVRTGDPGLEIGDYARDCGADLIVIPSHGYHGARRLVMGSVAERVLRHAECPILVLRRRDAD